MIAYFSGTGNSQYIARLIASRTGDELFSINAALKQGIKPCVADEKIVFVLPIYAWQMPKVVENWISALELSDKKVYFVFTCGGDIGNAYSYAKRAVEKAGAIYCGSAEVVMPDNCITLFDPPTEEKSLAIIAKAEESLEDVVDYISKGEKLPQRRCSIIGKLESSLVNKGFYRYFVKGEKLYATDKCVLCGQCVELCPLSNITIDDGRIRFGDYCTQCMACICHCKTEAIEYADKTKGKRRYLCPKQ